MQRNYPLHSTSSRNRREHGISPWLVLPDFLPQLTLEIVNDIVYKPSTKYFKSAQSVPSSDQASSQLHSVFPSPVFLHTNRFHVLPVAPQVYQPSWAPLLDTKRRPPLDCGNSSIKRESDPVRTSVRVRVVLDDLLNLLRSR